MFTPAKEISSKSVLTEKCPFLVRICVPDDEDEVDPSALWYGCAPYKHRTFLVRQATYEDVKGLTNSAGISSNDLYIVYGCTDREVNDLYVKHDPSAPKYYSAIIKRHCKRVKQ